MPQSIASIAFAADAMRNRPPVSGLDSRQEFEWRRRDTYDAFSNYLAIPATASQVQDRGLPDHVVDGPPHVSSARSQADDKSVDVEAHDSASTSSEPPPSATQPENPLREKPSPTTHQKPSTNSARPLEVKESELTQGGDSGPVRQPTDLFTWKYLLDALGAAIAPGITSAVASAIAQAPDSGVASIAEGVQSVYAPVSQANGSDAGAVELDVAGNNSVDTQIESLVQSFANERDGLPRVETTLASHATPRPDIDGGVSPSLIASEQRDAQPLMHAESAAVTQMETDEWDPQQGSTDPGGEGSESARDWSQPSAATPGSQISPTRASASQPSFGAAASESLDARQPLNEGRRHETNAPRSYRIALDSPELGRITLRVQELQGVRAHLIARNELAYQALAAAMDDARQWLQNAGVSLADFSLSQGHHQQAHSQFGQEPSTHHEQDRPSTTVTPRRPSWSGRLNVLA